MAMRDGVLGQRSCRNKCIFKEDKTGSLLFNSTVSTYWVISLYDPARANTGDSIQLIDVENDD
jgi:hypothetical protein